MNHILKGEKCITLKISQRLVGKVSFQISCNLQKNERIVPPKKLKMARFLAIHNQSYARLKWHRSAHLNANYPKFQKHLGAISLGNFLKIR